MQALWLMKNGVPFDVAHAMEPHELLAYGIGFGILEGGKFDWERLRWLKPEET